MGDSSGANLPVDDHGLVDLRLRHPSLAFAEEPGDPVRPPARVADPAALEKILAGKAVSGCAPRAARDDPPGSPLAVSGGIRSSASRTRIQGSRHRSMANCFCGPNPRQGSAKTSQPKSAAIRASRRCCPNPRRRSDWQRRRSSGSPGRFIASLKVITATESADFSSIV